jgi:hypothetical protein
MASNGDLIRSALQTAYGFCFKHRRAAWATKSARRDIPPDLTTRAFLQVDALRPYLLDVPLEIKTDIGWQDFPT